MHRPIRVAHRLRHWLHPARAKDFKTLVLTAFFGYFLPLLAESTPRSAHDMRFGAKGTDCHTSDVGHWLWQ